MAKARKKNKQKQGSLLKNSFLFVVSIGILAGATFIFHNILQIPGLPIKNFISQSIAGIEAPLAAVNNKLPQEVKTNNKNPKSGVEEKKQPEESIKFSFYDILYHQDHSIPSPDDQYSIRVASSKSKKKAMDYAAALKKSNQLDCRVTKKSGVYVVLWGSFSTKISADRYNKKLSKALEKTCVVVTL